MSLTSFPLFSFPGAFTKPFLKLRNQSSVLLKTDFNSLEFGGDEQNRTVDPLLARQVLSQLSYTPIFTFLFLIPHNPFGFFLVGSSGLEPPTSRLSGVRSNHLSYEPLFAHPRLNPQN